MGSPQAIPLTEILAYAKTYGFERETKLLILCVMNMDFEYFEFQNEKSEAKSRKAKK